MLRVFLSAVLALSALLSGCRTSDPVRDFSATEVTLPNGTKIKAEVMFHPTDLARGMMFRDSLAPDRGMLFIHRQPGHYAYWMYQTRIPLDIIWMDRGKRIVEISPNTPPCTSTSARQCPQYGGHEEAMYVLELAAGMAAKYGLGKGQEIQFY